MSSPSDGREGGAGRWVGFVLVVLGLVLLAVYAEAQGVHTLRFGVELLGELGLL